MEKLLSIKEVSLILGYSVATIRSLIKFNVLVEIIKTLNLMKAN